jgi:hypothetical protein
MRTGESTKRPVWVTTAAHLQPASEEGRMPWGTCHVKEETSPRTACGRPAATWRLFRHVRFDPLNDSACQDCAKQMVLMDS